MGRTLGLAAAGLPFSIFLPTATCRCAIAAHAVDHLQRRDLQLPRFAPGVEGEGTPVRLGNRHRSCASSLRRRGPGLRQAAERHVCLCHLRSSLRHAESVCGAGSLRSQAFLLLRTRATALPSLPKSRRCCKFPASKRELDPEALHQYLTFLWVPDPATMFRGIHKLPAGHYAIFRDGQFKLTKYWDLTFPAADAVYPRSEDELAEEIRERFRRSVEGQMVSDVPIGAFLSAGLDSSSIVAMMSRATRQPVRTYTITFPPKYRVGENALDDPDVADSPGTPFGMREPPHCGGAGCRRSAASPHLAHGRTHGRPGHHSRVSGLPRSAQSRRLFCSQGWAGTSFLRDIASTPHTTGRRPTGGFPAAARGADCRDGLRGFPILRGTPVKGSVRLMKKMARSASLSPADRFMMNCTYLDAEQKSALYAPAFGAEMSRHPIRRSAIAPVSRKWRTRTS